MRKTGILWLCFGLAVFAGGLVSSQQRLTAAQVMEKSIAATGGRKAYDKIKSTYVKGNLEMTGQGLKGQFEIYSKAPNKILVVQKLDGIGEFRQGYDGKLGWAVDPIQGNRQLSGIELEQLKREATFNSVLKWRELYSKVEMLGMKKVGNQKTYAVRLTPKTGKPITQYFDVKTFLMVRADSVQEGPQGTIPVTVLLSDYRVVDGVKVPFKMRQKFSMGEVMMQITQVKNNVPMNDSMFVRPKPQ